MSAPSSNPAWDHAPLLGHNLVRLLYMDKAGTDANASTLWVGAVLAPHAQGIERTFRCEVGKAAPDGTCRNPGRADNGRDTAVASQTGFCDSQQAALWQYYS